MPTSSPTAASSVLAPRWWREGLLFLMTLVIAALAVAIYQLGNDLADARISRERDVVVTQDKLDDLSLLVSELQSENERKDTVIRRLVALLDASDIAVPADLLVDLGPRPGPPSTAAPNAPGPRTTGEPSSFPPQAAPAPASSPREVGPPTRPSARPTPATSARPTPRPSPTGGLLSCLLPPRGPSVGCLLPTLPPLPLLPSLPPPLSL